MNYHNDGLIASLDVGTSTVRCILVDKYGHIQGQSKSNVNLIIPEPGFVEINPEELWGTVLDVIRKALQTSNLSYRDIRSFGISCQRNSFITWNKTTNETYHNFITWNDIRAEKIVKSMNNSFKVKLFRIVSKFLYILTRNSRFLAGSLFKLTNAQIAPRLKWVLENIPEVLKDVKKNNVAFGTIDTWLLYKLSDGLLHVTDVSNASSLGLFDPFILSWSHWAFSILDIPENIFPIIVNSAGYHFDCTAEKIFGRSIPIHCSIADQSASLFGNCCFKPGDTKLTLGTGTFLNVNTGSIPHTSFKGLYPLVAWKFNNELVYMAEGASNNTGIVIKWAQQIGLFKNPEDSAQIAQSVDDNNGVYFVPAFSGLQAPIDDAGAATGFIGVKSTTTISHLLRAMLESIVYCAFQLFDAFYNETAFTPGLISLDGGVSCNDFVMQLLADIVNMSLQRGNTEEMSAMGAAYLAGLSCGVWKNKEEIYGLKKITHIYNPNRSSLNYLKKEYLNWCKAVNRFTNWY